MNIAITGTPGVGKTSISKILKQKKYNVIDIKSIAEKKHYYIGIDKKRNSKIIDINKVDIYIKNSFSQKNIVFIEGHLSHLLKNIQKIIILRCHPYELKKRLNNKKWNEEKINENIMSEILDIILCETLEIHNKNNVFEIDTTKMTKKQITNCIIEIINNDFKPMKNYIIGKIDWSEEIYNYFSG